MILAELPQPTGAPQIGTTVADMAEKCRTLTDVEHRAGGPHSRASRIAPRAFPDRGIGLLKARPQQPRRGLAPLMVAAKNRIGGDPACDLAGGMAAHPVGHQGQ